MPYLKDWAFGRSKGCGQCGWRGGQPPDTPGKGEETTGNGFDACFRGVGTTGDGSPVGSSGRGSPGYVVATIVAPDGDVNVRGDRAGGNIREFADP